MKSELVHDPRRTMDGTFGTQQEAQIREALWLLNASRHYTVGRRPKGSGLFGATISEASHDGNRFTVVTDQGSLTVEFDILQISQGMGAGSMLLYNDDADALIIENGQFSSVREQQDHEARVREAFTRLGWSTSTPQGFLE